MYRIILTAVLILATHIITAAQRQGSPSESIPVPTREYSNRNETLQGLLTSGNEALFAMRLDEAIQLFEKGIALSPKDPVFWTNKSHALIEAGA